MAKNEHYTATIDWTREGPDFPKDGAKSDFVRGRYSRKHTWHFDCGISLPASPSPHVVPAPWSDPAAVDPEEAFIAAIASCHMLTFLWLASKEGFQADSYHDVAKGVMTPNDKGKLWVSRVVLSPKISWSGSKLPTPADCERLHHSAHEECFIANSVKTEVVVEND